MLIYDEVPRASGCRLNFHARQETRDLYVMNKVEAEVRASGLGEGGGLASVEALFP